MNNITKILLPVMQTVGAAILQVQQAGVVVTRKGEGENDIVTKGDIVANDILHTELNAAFPDIGWLSEESEDDHDRLDCEQIWIVDPIDGTKEFAAGLPEYAISVALVERGVPIVASVFNPASGQLFYAEAGKGAYLGNQQIHCKRELSELTFLASRTEYKRGKWDRFKQYKIETIGSIAYKLALIAAGVGDATFSLGPKNEWDIAAGVLLVQEAGGLATNRKQEPIIFNNKNVLVDGIVATSAPANELVFNLIGKLD